MKDREKNYADPRESREEKAELLAAERRAAELEKEAEREDARARRRIEEARRREEKKQAQMKAQAERERVRAEKAAVREEERREREMRAQQEKQHRRAERAEKKLEEKRRREEKSEKAPGYGGWLAAVVSLSVAVLALGAIVTVGYFDLSKAKGAALGGYQANVYELSEQVEMLDADFAKVRVAQGSYETQKLLADVLVRCRLAERCVENFPVDGRSAAQLTAFFNRAGDYSQTLLHRVAAGGTLGAEEEETIAYLYGCVETLRNAMPALIEAADGSNAEGMWSEGGEFSARFSDLTAGMEEMSEGVRKSLTGNGAAAVCELEAITEEKATERANAYFSEYKVTDLRCTGKSEGEYACYLFEFGDEAGRTYYAQITERGGILAMFDSYAPCGGQNFDGRHCTHIAREFLAKAGYEGMRPVFASEAGGECCITFVYEQDGVLVYPDRVMVKVCCERGVVTGLEGHEYLRNHCEREIGAAKVSMEKVERNAAKKMQLHGVRKAIIPVDGQERLTYEVRGEYGGRMYYAYIDAVTGETAEIRVVADTDRGMSLL